jgi:hypothetical protein
VIGFVVMPEHVHLLLSDCLGHPPFGDAKTFFFNHDEFSGDFALLEI